ncbi:MAG: hypothetical protein KTR31_15995 [Myxococcales bacterium]|nr:hypothetical protein [Myxococcales bacterium]
MSRCWMVLLLLLLPLSMGADSVGIPVTVRVIDAQTGEPIRTAVVRHPREQDRHRVNTETGQWTESVLYMPDGSELVFEKGMELEFEVSAPGYANQRVTYLVRRRKNTFEVPLTRMEIDLSDEDPEDVIIQFGRDKPIQ